MLKKSTLLSVSIFFLLFIGLSDYGYGCHGGKPPHGDCKGGGGDGGSAQYSVKVIFDDFECDTTNVTRDHFCSDAMGYYIDGIDDVNAGGDKFRFALGLKTGTERRFFLDFSDNSQVCPECVGDGPVLDGGDKGLNFGGGNGGVFSTADPGFSLLDMADPSSGDRNLTISFSDTLGDRWGLSFSPDQCAGSNPVTVTRFGDTWYFEPKDDGIACLKRPEKRGKSSPPIVQGLYKVPFGFTAKLLLEP